MTFLLLFLNRHVPKKKSSCGIWSPVKKNFRCLRFSFCSTKINCCIMKSCYTKFQITRQRILSVRTKNMSAFWSLNYGKLCKDGSRLEPKSFHSFSTGGLVFNIAICSCSEFSGKTVYIPFLERLNFRNFLVSSSHSLFSWIVLC